MITSSCLWKPHGRSISVDMFISQVRIRDVPDISGSRSAERVNMLNDILNAAVFIYSLHKVRETILPCIYADDQNERYLSS